MKGKISFIKEVAIKNVEGIKKILAGARPDYEYASEEAGRIAEALARIPRIEAEIKSLEDKLK